MNCRIRKSWCSILSKSCVFIVSMISISTSVNAQGLGNFINQLNNALNNASKELQQQPAQQQPSLVQKDNSKKFDRLHFICNHRSKGEFVYKFFRVGAHDDITAKTFWNKQYRDHDREYESKGSLYEEKFVYFNMQNQEQTIDFNSGYVIGRSGERLVQCEKVNSQEAAIKIGELYRPAKSQVETAQRDPTSVKHVNSKKFDRLWFLCNRKSGGEFVYQFTSEGYNSDGSRGITVRVFFDRKVQVKPLSYRSKGFLHEEKFVYDNNKEQELTIDFNSGYVTRPSGERLFQCNQTEASEATKKIDVLKAEVGQSEVEKIYDFIRAYDYDSDVVAQILNYSFPEIHNEKGLIGETAMGWYAVDKKKCIYALAKADRETISASSWKEQMLDLNSLDPKSIKIVPDQFRNPFNGQITDYYVIQHDGKLLFKFDYVAGVGVDRDRIKRGWNLIYSDYCKGKKKAF